MPLTLPSKQVRQYTTSKQLIGGDDFNGVVAQLNSSAVGITAGVGGGSANAVQLANAFNTISIVISANDSVKLPKGFAGLEVSIANQAAANSLQVFTSSKGLINNIDGVVTGVAIAASQAAYTLYSCFRIDVVNGEIWLSK